MGGHAGILRHSPLLALEGTHSGSDSGGQHAAGGWRALRMLVREPSESESATAEALTGDEGPEGTRWRRQPARPRWKTGLAALAAAGIAACCLVPGRLGILQQAPTVAKEATRAVELQVTGLKVTIGVTDLEPYSTFSPAAHYSSIREGVAEPTSTRPLPTTTQPTTAQPTPPPTTQPPTTTTRGTTTHRATTTHRTTTHRPPTTTHERPTHPPAHHLEHEKEGHGRHPAAKNASEGHANDWVYANARPGEAWPSLFCWSHIEEFGGERALLASQVKAKFGIFRCNDFAVISRSQKPIPLGPHPKNPKKTLMTWTNALPKDVKGNPAIGDATSSYKNAKTFLIAWKTLMHSGVLWNHDWVAKVDPDAVFYPERLRWHIEQHTKPPKGPGPFYVINCDVDGGRLYGALEVFAVRALKEMDKRGHECEAMPLGKWGEDLFMEQCMKYLNGKKNGIHDYRLVGDERCTKGPCSDGFRVAFHPKPSIHEYWSCAAQAPKKKGKGGK